MVSGGLIELSEFYPPHQPTEADKVLGLPHPVRRVPSNLLIFHPSSMQAGGTQFLQPAKVVYVGLSWELLFHPPFSRSRLWIVSAGFVTELTLGCSSLESQYSIDKCF